MQEYTKNRIKPNTRIKLPSRQCAPIFQAARKSPVAKDLRGIRRRRLKLVTGAASKTKSNQTKSKSGASIASLRTGLACYLVSITAHSQPRASTHRPTPCDSGHPPRVARFLPSPAPQVAIGIPGRREEDRERAAPREACGRTRFGVGVLGVSASG